jgi:hypothetical protein
MIAKSVTDVVDDGSVPGYEADSMALKSAALISSAVKRLCTTGAFVKVQLNQLDM